MDYTITIKGATNEAGTEGEEEIELGVWIADPDRVKEGEDLELASGYIDESLLERRTFQIEFEPFSTASGEDEPNYDTLETLQDILKMPHKWITGCSLPRWQESEGFTRLAALLPIKFVVTGRSKNLNRERASIDFTINVSKQTRES